MGWAMTKGKFNQRKWAAKYVTGLFAHEKNETVEDANSNHVPKVQGRG